MVDPSPPHARLRDSYVHQYLEPWLYTFYRTATSAASFDLDCAQDAAERPPLALRDQALTAFAQLASLRTGCKRALISLIDTSTQYILTEATRTMSLDGLNCEDPSDSLLYGRANVSRTTAVCGTAVEILLKTASHSPCLIVHDLQQDPRFKTHCDLARSGNYHFYAAVPIYVHASTNRIVGTLCVFDSQPRSSFAQPHVDLLASLAQTTTAHLERVRMQLLQSKGERMMKSFSLLKGGHGSVRNWWLAQQIQRRGDGPTPEFLNEVGESADELFGPEQAPFEHHQANSGPELGKASSARDSSPASNSSSSTRRDSKVEDEERFDTAQRQSLIDTDQQALFSRASNLLREAMSMSGVIFFDASTNDWVEDRRISSTSDRQIPTANGPPSSTKQQDNKPAVCPVFGFSVTAKSSLMQYGPSTHHKLLPKSFLRTLIDHYPEGRIFNFTKTGSMSSSSESDISTQDRVKANEELFRRLAPGARSLAFLPLWDWQKNRWFSACFCYTTNPLRILNDSDLTHLNAFCICVMHVMSGMTVARSETSKSLFLSTISHEMRSPLHGILAGTDFLRDVPMNAFGQSMLATVETSGRALLDTVNHVLEFANISSATPLGEHMSPRKPAAEIEEEFDIALVIEELVSSICLGSFATGKDETNPGNAVMSLGDEASPTQPYIIIDVDWTRPWTVKSISCAAVRRIVMNLVRNAFKFTQNGYIIVSLKTQSAENLGSKLQDTNSHIVLGVEDSGCGIAPEFLRHHLFTPFIKEDALSPGIGLGLHLTRNLVQELNGKLEFQSELGRGTTARVIFPVTALPSSPRLMRSIETPDAIRGISVDALGFSQLKSRGETALHKSLQSILGHALGIQITFLEQLSDATGDILMIRDEEFEERVAPVILDDAEKPLLSPMLVLCRNLAYAHRRTRDFPHIEFLAPPLGPTSIGRVLRKYTDMYPVSPYTTDSEVDVPRTPSTLATEQFPPIQIKLPWSSNATPPAESQPNPAIKLASMPHRPLRSSRPPTPTERDQLKKLKLLVVEDNAINLRLLVAFAKKHAIKHVAAENGQEALNEYVAALSTDAPFNAVVTDVSMPIMDGIEFTQQARRAEGAARDSSSPSSGPQSKCMIIAVTGVSSDMARKDAMEAGVDVFLSKPAPFKRILSLLMGRNA